MTHPHGSIPSISLNQIGYRPHDDKIALFAGMGGSFYVEDSKGMKVCRGETLKARNDAGISGQTVYYADFSALMKPGTYRIVHVEAGASEAFVIEEKPYKEVHKGLLKAFYYFRCGIELQEEFAAPWTHHACHLAPAIVYGQEDRRIDVCGGWHDAGDYGKYAGPGAKAVADLLLAFELYPNAFVDAVPLPETDGRIPDVLHECRYELDFLLNMQDEETGGVFHKVTTLQFPSLDCMPEHDLADLYLSPISAAATGCFAGVMAMAARVYQPYDAAYAEVCLRAAERAYAWLERNPDVPGFKNPPEIATGEYGDKLDHDERYWASAELYRTTGDQRYHQALKAWAAGNTFELYELGWADMGGYGTIAYLLTEKDRVDLKLYDKLQCGLVEDARRLAIISEQDGYGISLAPEQYIWGSNMLVMNNAMLMLIAHHFYKDSALEKCALDHVHYLLGRNALSMSYVTGYGTNPIRNPHHRPSVGDGVADPVPGQVAGGPNRHLQDDYAKVTLTGQPPAKCFVDHMDSYATNEVTIYWNSPAVFVFSHFAS
ncbi:glycoside hydrolase family 9 protein [Paenibacillus hexagrammi]|uniref:Endoglucanase n=1 Tax=Paenibacillus hexagrammi TaxID=2908839 RepID=A0ABY3SDJ4_9BACL|nr:glycoside hydrolase family 9 protein [Paenibacillus sp. YPD9-1]UJF31892.1 glycoside hydrolase family 9 protein [Paenibacillus sp. YPD9-1]